ncbi:MAG: hypothetical protein OEZ04_14030 [Nitrospinota bacterium]|nr:hypothetical protein [Nitrospinota bacterium]
MFRIILILAGLFLLVGGGNETYNGMNQSEMAKMPVAQFVKSGKDIKWIALTDAKLDLLKAITVSSGKTGKIKELYIPIESKEYRQGKSVNLLLESNDKKLLDLAQKLKDMDKASLTKYVLENRGELLTEGEVSGTVWTKNSLSSSRRDEIKGLVSNLDENFYIMNHNATISLTRGIVILAIGAGVLLLGLRRKKAPAA